MYDSFVGYQAVGTRTKTDRGAPVVKLFGETIEVVAARIESLKGISRRYEWTLTGLTWWIWNLNDIRHVFVVHSGEIK